MCPSRRWPSHDDLWDESHAAAVETWDPSWAGAASSWHFGLIDGAPVGRNGELPLKLSPLPVAEPDFEQLGSLAFPKFSKSLSAIDIGPGISDRFNLY